MPGLSLQQWSVQLDTALAKSHQRLIVDCAGDLTWCQGVAQNFLQHKKSLLISDNKNFLSSQQSVAANKSIQCLGQEFDVVIFDAFNGFDVDAFVRVAGVIKAPGLLLLLRPNTQQWLCNRDPKNTWQDGQQGHPYFLNYFLQQLLSSSVLSCHEGLKRPTLAALISSEKTAINASTNLSTQQQLAWDELTNILGDDDKSLALIAHRGRGKSTLLGRWLKQTDFSTKKFIVTSDSKKAAGQCLSISRDNKNVRYEAIDALLINKPHADCIIVDEAATIPVALLLELKQHYKKIIVTSTLDGYEGTGQGFELQFLSAFKENTLQVIELTAPMRWGQQDLLEGWLNKAFMLQRAKDDIQYQRLDIEYKEITQKQLSRDVALLSDVFQLLKSAHYRTQTSDLRMLLDNPDISVFLAQAQGSTLGVLLLSAEGGLSPELTHDIHYGKRRPQGHLLAQGLTVHGGCAQFAQLKGVRVQRIAVAKEYRQQGIGSQLIQCAVNHALQNKADYLGAVFALDEKRINFWQKNKMALMMVSVGQGTSTGKPSVTMLMSLSPATQNCMTQCQEHLAASFSERLLTHFKLMPPAQVFSLLKILPAMGLNNARVCDAYINGFKGFEYALFDLRRHVFYLLQQEQNPLNKADCYLLLEAILQVKPWSDLIKNYQLSGKKEINQRLKAVLKRAIK